MSISRKLDVTIVEYANDDRLPTSSDYKIEHRPGTDKPHVREGNYRLDLSLDEPMWVWWNDGTGTAVLIVATDLVEQGPSNFISIHDNGKFAWLEMIMTDRKLKPGESMLYMNKEWFKQ